MTREGIGTAIIVFVFLALAAGALVAMARGIMDPSPHTVCQAEYGSQSKWDYDIKRCIDGVEPKMSRVKP